MVSSIRVGSVVASWYFLRSMLKSPNSIKGRSGEMLHATNNWSYMTSSDVLGGIYPPTKRHLLFPETSVLRMTLGPYVRVPSTWNLVEGR